MKKIVILLLALSLFFINNYSTEADSSPQVVYIEATSTPAVISAIATSIQVKSLIRQYSDKYQVSYAVMNRVVSCETGGTYDPLIQSYVRDKKGPNGRENSWGLVQIDLDWWPEITKEQAQDPDFALDFLGSKLYSHQGHYWTCYRTRKV